MGGNLITYTRDGISALKVQRPGFDFGSVMIWSVEFKISLLDLVFEPCLFFICSGMAGEITLFQNPSCYFYCYAIGGSAYTCMLPNTSSDSSKKLST
jgi:hypothetical protein